MDYVEPIIKYLEMQYCNVSVFIINLFAVTMIAMSCQPDQSLEKGYSPEIRSLSDDRLTPELLWQLGRISDESVSPDQSKILYAITWYSIEDNKGYRDLYLFDLSSQESIRLTDTKINESQAAWRPDGKRIGFLCDQSGSQQLWEIDLSGRNRKQITFIDGGIDGFKYSPCGLKLVLVKRVKLDQSVNDQYPDLPKANARIETDLMYRHWDQWHDYSYNHLWIANYSESGISEAIDIMPGEPYHAPTMPYGGLEEVSWSPDGLLLAYTCKKKRGKEYAFSTNSEIWLYNTQTHETRNMTEGNMGYDRNPVFSPDGRTIAWESMARDGYESDQARLFVINLETDEKINLFEQFEESVQAICWSKDGKSIWFISDKQATDEIFNVQLDNHEIKQLTNGIHNYKSLALAGQQLLTRKQSMSYPDELFLVSLETGLDTAITSINQPIFDQLETGRVEKRWVKTTDNKSMLVWVVYPPHFDPSKKYPALLYCQGGPQGTVSQFWSYRWNLQLMAAHGYIVIAPNRRGLPGFGMEWLEQISKDYGGQNIQDYLSAIDQVSDEPYVDKDCLGAVGASYGGFSVYYLAGHHQKRFKAFVAHCGMFNFEQLYATTEEMWFVNWDLGGAFWDSENKQAMRSYSFSPHHFVDKWDTPILVIHGGNDFRIPYTQGMAAYNAAIMKDIPAKFLFFPEENHWVLKPQDALVWQRTFFEWLDTWLKKKNTD